MLRIPCAVLAALLAASFAFGAPAEPEVPRLDPDPEAEALGRTAEPLPAAAMIRAAILFSGASPRDAPALEAVLLERAEEAREATSGLADPASRGEALLAHMHEGLAGRYVEAQTRIDVLLSSGNYNCVSSAVYYMVLGKASGLEVGGVIVPSHAFCTVRTAAGPVDVETTNRYGWDPGTRKEFHDSFGKATGYAYVPPRDYAGRKAVGEKALLALILANRVVDLERAGRYAEAVALAVDRSAAVGDADSAEFLSGRLFNYGGYLVNRGRTEEALGFVDRVRARYGEVPRLDALRRTAVSNRLSELASAGRYDEAVDFLGRMRARYGDDPSYGGFLAAAVNNQVVALVRDGQWARARALLEERLAAGLAPATEGRRLSALISSAELDDAVARLPFRGALEAALAARRDGAVGKPRFAEILVYLYSTEGQRISKASGWLEAARLVEEALALIPGQARLLEIRAVFRGNHAAEAHNRFAALYNAKRYAEAGEAAAAGLREVPESDLLRRDVERAAQAASGSVPSH